MSWGAMIDPILWLLEFEGLGVFSPHEVHELLSLAQDYDLIYEILTQDRASVGDIQIGARGWFRASRRCRARGPSRNS
jgi:hypothetical protein